MDSVNLVIHLHAIEAARMEGVSERSLSTNHSATWKVTIWNQKDMVVPISDHG